MDRKRQLQAACDRAQWLPPQTSVSATRVKEAVKAFNSQVIAIPDYMHTHPSLILDALHVLEKILTDLIQHSGRSPKDPSKPVCSFLLT